MLVFSYGSNHPEQLAHRLGHKVKTKGAFLTGYQRVFCGYSQSWGGGVASVEPQRGGTVFGHVFNATKADLETLDRYEGVAIGAYSRHTVNVIVMPDEKSHEAIVYISNRREFNEPSRAYLEAIAKTVGAHWRNDDGGIVQWKDITVRSCRRAG